MQQPPSLTQNFQIAPNRESMRYVNSIEEVQKDTFYGETPYFSKDMSVLWVKTAPNSIKTYELREIINKDEKDLKIEFLMAQIEDLKKGMVENAMEQGQMMDNGEFVRNFLDRRFKRIPYDEIYIGEFAENHPIGKYLITTPGHITTCINGYIIDTWDCTDRKVEYVWKIKD